MVEARGFVDEYQFSRSSVHLFPLFKVGNCVGRMVEAQAFVDEYQFSRSSVHLFPLSKAGNCVGRMVEARAFVDEYQFSRSSLHLFLVRETGNCVGRMVEAGWCHAYDVLACWNMKHFGSLVRYGSYAPADAAVNYASPSTVSLVTMPRNLLSKKPTFKKLFLKKGLEVIASSV